MTNFYMIAVLELLTVLLEYVNLLLNVHFHKEGSVKLTSS